jgi:tripartite-type tricarboxylate transporter receptor subunit TctC
MFLFVGVGELSAQKYPSRPITLVIPTIPGDNLDMSGRLAADELSKLLGVPVIPLNKAGASMLIGTDFAAKSKKDGYTILIVNLAGVIQAKVLEPEIVPFDPFKDLTPLGSYWASIFLIAISGNAPYKNIKELLEYQKKNPAPFRCGTAGPKGASGLNADLLQIVTGVKVTSVPFKGGSETVTALLGGHTEAASSSVSLLGAHLKSGAMRGIAISSHSPDFPDIPTLKELGYKQNLLAGWPNFFAPAGIPKEVNQTLVSAIEKMVKNPGIISKLANLDMPMEYLPPDKVLARMHEEYGIVQELGKRFGMVK